MTGPFSFCDELLSYRHRTVRDLAWSILVPSIVRVRPTYRERADRVARDAWGIDRPLIVSSPDTWFTAPEAIEAYRRCERALRELDADERNRSLLVERIGRPPGGRLGLLHERLVAEWIRIDPLYELLDRDVSVVEEGQTRGQMDLIVRRTGGAVEQWEIAIKFFLQTGPAGRLDRWVGTDLHDRLDRKIAHLASHQLTVAFSAAGRRALAGRESPAPERARALLRGILFFAVDDTGDDGGAGNDNRRLRQPDGWWMRPATFEARSWGGIEQWLVATYEQWFSPIYAAEIGNENQTYSEAGKLVREIRNDLSQRPVLVIGMAGGVEETRGFLFDRRFAIQDPLDTIVEGDERERPGVFPEARVLSGKTVV